MTHDTQRDDQVADELDHPGTPLQRWLQDQLDVRAEEIRDAPPTARELHRRNAESFARQLDAAHPTTTTEGTDETWL